MTEELARRARAMRLKWLGTSVGANIVALGIVAIVFALFISTFGDIVFLVTGNVWTPGGFRSVWYPLWEALAALFSAITFFVWRPALPRIMIALFAVSMASHVVERFAPMPAQQLRLVAICRLLISLGLALVYLNYRWTVRSVRSHN